MENSRTLAVGNNTKEEFAPLMNFISGSVMDEYDSFRYLLEGLRNSGNLPQSILPFEIEDGFGSYVCEDGFLHDYSKLDYDWKNEKLYGPFDTIEEMNKALHGDDIDV
jgi:hypothetical protein